MEAGAKTPAEIDAWVAQKKAANAATMAPRVLEAVPRYEPRHRTSERSAIARAGAGARRVTHANRRRLITNGDEITGVDEIHPLRVDPLHEENLGAAYRLHRARLPLANAMYERGVNAAANARFATVDQKRRRKTLGNVTRRRANLGERADMDSVNAALADLSARAALNAANAMAIAAIGERLYEIMETNS